MEAVLTCTISVRILPLWTMHYKNESNEDKLFFVYKKYNKQHIDFKDIKTESPF